MGVGGVGKGGDRGHRSIKESLTRWKVRVGRRTLGEGCWGGLFKRIELRRHWVSLLVLKECSPYGREDEDVCIHTYRIKKGLETGTGLIQCKLGTRVLSHTLAEYDAGCAGARISSTRHSANTLGTQAHL